MRCSSLVRLALSPLPRLTTADALATRCCPLHVSRPIGSPLALTCGSVAYFSIRAPASHVLPLRPPPPERRCQRDRAAAAPTAAAPPPRGAARRRGRGASGAPLSCLPAGLRCARCAPAGARSRRKWRPSARRLRLTRVGCAARVVSVARVRWPAARARVKQPPGCATCVSALVALRPLSCARSGRSGRAGVHLGRGWDAWDECSVLTPW